MARSIQLAMNAAVAWKAHIVPSARVIAAPSWLLKPTVPMWWPAFAPSGR